MAIQSGNSAVSISNTALMTAKKIQEKRLAEKGVKSTIGAIVSEAVFIAFGNLANENETSGGPDGVET